MSKYNELASDEAVINTINALEGNGMHGEVVDTKEKALERIKELIPTGASVHNGSSVTLQEIGFVDYLKTENHGWNNLHSKILAEKDPDTQTKLRKESVFSDYYLGSAHAVSETGEIVIASNTGSQLPHLVFTSQNIILVVGTQKITSDLSEAIKRLKEYVVPIEDVRIMELYKSHTVLAKTLIMHKENPVMGRNVLVIFVKEKLGY